MSAPPPSGREPVTDAAGVAAAAIGLDWGTSNLRAFLLAGDGAVLAQRERPWGILNLPAPAAEGGFDQALADIAGDWLAAHPAVPLVASGMVGSAQGWREAPYVACPATAATIAAGFATVQTAGARLLHIAPGLLLDRPDELPDVMRGEETQVIGAIDPAAPQGACCFVLPGTHCKWVLARGGRIEAFTTAMTGEVFAALTRHTILGRLMEPAAVQDTASARETASGEGWARGLALARQSRPGDLMRQLFTARSMHLAGRLPRAELADYLSALLIGHELVSALAWLAARAGARVPLVLVGEAALTARYRRALEAFGMAAETRDNTAAAGLHRLAQLAGIR